MSLFARFGRRLQNNDSALNQGDARDLRETAATTDSIAQIFNTDIRRQEAESGFPRREPEIGGGRRHRWIGA